MSVSFSPLPLMNRLLEIAREEAQKKGHVIDTFERVLSKKDVVYTAQCPICRADVRVVCGVSKYQRTGTAFSATCKPG